MKTLLASTKLSSLPSDTLPKIDQLAGLVRGSGFGRGGLVKIETMTSVCGDLRAFFTFGTGAEDVYEMDRYVGWTQKMGLIDSAKARSLATKKGFRK